MADLSITAASVAPAGDVTIFSGIAGAAITAGQMLYLDSSTGTLKLADANSGTAAARSPCGMALNGAASGQTVGVARRGNVTAGATLTAGVGYYLSATPGGICPVADLSTGAYPTFLGFATSTTVLALNIIESGVSL